MILSSKAREAAKWLVLISLETTLATSSADFPAKECTGSVPAVINNVISREIFQYFLLDLYP
jgi:hypothetical protein